MKQISNLEDGCEISKYRHRGNSLILSDYTKITKTNQSFDFHEPEKKFISITAINNGCQINDVINVTGKIIALNASVTKSTSYGELVFTEGIISDGGDKINISLKNDYDGSVNKDKTYKFTNMRISKYAQIRFLKTQETTTISECLHFP